MKSTITLIKDEDSVSIKVNVAGVPSGKYAFYLYRNKEKIDTIWYSSNSSVIFNISKTGMYYAMAFVRDDTGSTKSYRSNTVSFLGNTIDISLDDLFIHKDELGSSITRFNVLSGKYKIPCYISLNGLSLHQERKLFVLLSGAAPIGAPTPLFNRISWESDFPGVVIAIADPVINEKNLIDGVRAGWYIGCSSFDLTSIIAGLVIKLSNVLNVDLGNVTTYGSSAGGFAAIQIARKVSRKALAISINPRLDVFTSNKVMFRNFCKVSFDRQEPDELRKYYLDRFQVPKNSSEISCRVLLVQNINDLDYYNGQFLHYFSKLNVPLINVRKNLSIEQSGLEELNSHVLALTYEGPNSHSGEPRELVSVLLSIANSIKTHTYAV
ncbi:hypothetical protein L4D20_16615 [Vibrio kyushuensis]|uniref:hypothetical protein n=1 Tax=Vibrio kyushuensis TaxID=2910249 RepID=UPI003D14ADF1